MFPVSSICNVQRDLKNARGGYLKSVCTIYQDINFSQANTSCSAIGMKLFVASSTEEINAITRHSNIQWPYGLFWVNGKNGTNCAVMSNDKSLTYSKREMSCSSNAYFHCEYQSNDLSFFQGRFQCNFVF
jgi:hypothetical protein